MNYIKDFLETKTKGWYVALATFLLALISLLIYVIRGGNSYSPISNTVIWLFIVGLISNLAILFKDYKVGAYVPFILYLVATGVIVNKEMLFISNVLTGLDNNFFDSAYVAFFVFLAITLVSAFVTTILKLTKNHSHL